MMKANNDKAVPSMRQWRGRRRETLGRLAATFLVVMATGCATTTVSTSDGRPMPPPPREGPVTPEKASINRLVLVVHSIKPQDTNGNGFPDTISAGVALFSNQHRMPTWKPGTFVFSLYPAGRIDDPEVTPLAQWTITGDEALAARTRDIIGPGYGFRLNLMDAGTDRYPLMGADLICRFDPADGAASVRSSVSPMQIGRGVAHR